MMKNATVKISAMFVALVAVMAFAIAFCAVNLQPSKAKAAIAQTVYVAIDKKSDMNWHMFMSSSPFEENYDLEFNMPDMIPDGYTWEDLYEENELDPSTRGNKVVYIQIIDKITPATCAYMFSNFYWLNRSGSYESTKLSNIDTSAAKSTEYMFDHCWNQRSTDFTSMYVGQNVKNISGMFYYATSNERKQNHLNLGNWDLSGDVVASSETFYYLPYIFQITTPKVNSTTRTLNYSAFNHDEGSGIWASNKWATGYGAPIITPPNSNSREGNLADQTTYYNARTLTLNYYLDGESVGTPTTTYYLFSKDVDFTSEFFVNQFDSAVAGRDLERISITSGFENYIANGATYRDVNVNGTTLEVNGSFYSVAVDLHFSSIVTPVASDFNVTYDTDLRFNYDEKEATVVSNNADVSGAITVYYNGSTTVPTEVGSYAVTIDVAESATNKAVTGLSVGSFEIVKHDVTGGSLSVGYVGKYSGAKLNAASFLLLDSTGISVNYNDFDVSYPNGDPINVGDHEVILTAKANSGYLGSVAGIFKIQPRPLSEITISTKNPYTYSGSPQTFEFNNISYNGYNLQYGTDYTLSQTEATDVSVYAVTITGKGNFTGTYDVNFAIIPKYISSATVTLGSALTYNGTAQTKTVVSVVLDGMTLVEGTDYLVNNNTGTDAGDYTLSVVGIGNYSSGLDLAWSIARKDIAGATVTLGLDLTYNGLAQTKEVVSALVDGLTVTYDVSGNTETNAGDYTLTVSGNGNFDGFVTKAWSIARKDIAGATVTLGLDLTYNGLAQTKEVISAVVDGLTVTYDVSGNTETNAGDYTLTVSGNGNFVGSVSKAWVINKANYDMSGITFDSKAFDYDNTAHSLAIGGTLPVGLDGIQVTVSYDNNLLVNVADGPKTVTANFSTASTNYNAPASMTATLTVNPIDYDMSGVTFEDKFFVYDAQPHTVTVTGTLPTGLDGVQVQVKYTWNGTDDVTVTTVPDGVKNIVATFLTESKNYNVPASMNADVWMIKVEIEIPAAVTDWDYVYNGQPQTYGLATSSLYTIDNATHTLAGEYVVTATINDTDNYEWTDKTVDVKEYNYVILKANYDMSGVILESKAFVYDGEAHTVTITGTLPTGYDGIQLQVFYDGVTVTDFAEGEKLVLAHFTTTSDNYVAPADMEAYVKIVKAFATRPTADDTVFTYNGKAQTYGVAESEMYVITGATETNAGSYVVTVTLVENYAWEDGGVEELTFDFSIGKADYDLSKLTLTDKVFDYDGKAHTVKLEGALPVGADGIRLVATGNNVSVTNAAEGEKTVIYTFTSESTNYNVPASMSAKISVAKISVAKPVGDESKFTYNGFEKTYIVAKNANYTVSGNKQTDAGSYVVTVALNDKNNYQWTDGTTADITFNFEIAKATYNMSGISFKDATFTYDGKEHTVVISGRLPEGITVSYTGGAVKSVADGEKTVTATFKVDEKNYEVPSALTAKIKVIKAKVDKPNVPAYAAFTYDGKEKKIHVADSVNYTVSGTTSAVGAGEYTATVALNDKANYEWTDGTTTDLTFGFVIAKATYNMNGVAIYDKTVIANGVTHAITVIGNLPAGVTVSYSISGESQPGVYSVTASFSGDAENYEAIPDISATLTVLQSVIEDENGSVSSLSGIAPDVVVSIDEIDSVEYDFGKKLELKKAYDVNMTKGGVSVQPDGAITVKLLIPDELKESEFKIYAVDGDKVTAIGYKVEGNYAVIATRSVSEFAFVTEKEAFPVWAIVLISVAGVAALAGVAFFIVKRVKG